MLGTLFPADDSTHLKLTIDESVDSELQSRDSYKSDSSSQQLETVLNLAKKVKSSDVTLDTKPSTKSTTKRDPELSRRATNERERRLVYLESYQHIHMFS